MHEPARIALAVLGAALLNVVHIRTCTGLQCTAPEGHRELQRPPQQAPAAGTPISHCPSTPALQRRQSPCCLACVSPLAHQTLGWPRACSGGMIFTFYKARGMSVGSSLVEDDKLELAKSLEELAKKKGVEFILPTDIVAADKFDENAKTQVVAAGDIPDGWMVSDRQCSQI